MAPIKHHSIAKVGRPFYMCPFGTCYHTNWVGGIVKVVGKSSACVHGTCSHLLDLRYVDGVWHRWCMVIIFRDIGSSFFFLNNICFCTFASHNVAFSDYHSLVVSLLFYRIFYSNTSAGSVRGSPGQRAAAGSLARPGESMSE